MIREELCITEEDQSKRLDKLLTHYFPSYSRTYFQYLIEEGCVLLNGEVVKKRTKPQAGDEVEVCFLLTPEISLSPEAIPLEILYEDEYLLAINKPSGMVVHPAVGHPGGTFVNALLYHCQGLESTDDPLRPGIVHRLDKETTGVLLAAKTKEAHRALVSLFSQRQIEKHYLAVCLGKVSDQTLHAPLKRHPQKRQEMVVCFEEGKEAISKCRLLASQEKFSLVEVSLITGRTHQIRAHMKYLRAPIIGDPVYGSLSTNRLLGLHRQLLHAHTLRFRHPFLGTPLELTAPLPQDMQDFLHKTGLLSF